MMWLKIPWPYLISRGWWPLLKIRLVLAVVLHMSWAWSAHSFGHAILSTGHGNNLWSSVTVASVWNSWIMHPWIIRTDIMLFMLNGYLALNTILQFTLGSRHYGHNFLNHDTPSDCPKLSSCRDTLSHHWTAGGKGLVFFLLTWMKRLIYWVRHSSINVYLKIWMQLNSLYIYSYIC